MFFFKIDLLMLLGFFPTTKKFSYFCGLLHRDFVIRSFDDSSRSFLGSFLG